LTFTSGINNHSVINLPDGRKKAVAKQRYFHHNFSITSVYALAIELYNEKGQKIVCNAWLQPPVAEKKPYFGGVLSAKIVC